jgi:FAD/FMN-containing dehydrogenase
MPKESIASVPRSAPQWKNWSENLVHTAPAGEPYYCAPRTLAELQTVLGEAAKQGVTVRVSGQRHAQPPLVVDDNRRGSPAPATTWLVDLSCYADLGATRTERMVLGPGARQVRVNTGVREDELDAFLTAHNAMLRTVTAGGFFSLGGMTAVDVHGSTIDAPIFAETVSAFTLVRADGSEMTIDAQSPAVGPWSPLQFARVSLGGLGIVTSVTIDVIDRPWATTLQGGAERLGLADKSAFVKKFQTLLKEHTRVETFFTPYATDYVPVAQNFLVLWWDVVHDPSPKTPNAPPHPEPPNACILARRQPPEYGAPYLQGFAHFGADVAQRAQYAVSPGNSPSGLFQDGIDNPAVIAAITFEVIEPEVATANQAHSELWLTGAVRVIFMSYYVPLPGLDEAGLGKVWDGLDVVSQIVTKDRHFHIAAPMEFRFVKGGNSAMSATFTEDPEHTWFVNFDLIGFVEKDRQASEYPAMLLQFFADVERKWVDMGGFPHQGKMYGFYDPTAAPTAPATAPFNANFLADLRRRRGARLESFNAYRKSLDPQGLFYNGFLRVLMEG